MGSEGAGIQDVHRLFIDSAYRTQLLSRISDPVALEFWLDEYEPATPSFQREVARPISNRIRKFYRNRKIRNVIGQSQSLDFRDIIDGNKIFLANLSGLADIEAETLGALLISKFQVAAMSRGSSSLDQPTDFYLYIDEVQSFITTSLPTAYSESRKYGLRLVTANQYLGQLDSRTLGAIMGNVGSTIIFRVGARDANALAPFVQPQFDRRDMVNLSRYNAIVKTQFLGETLSAFSMESLPPIVAPSDAEQRIARIRDSSRRQYARPREEVEAEFDARYGDLRRGPNPQMEPSDNMDGGYFG